MDIGTEVGTVAAVDEDIGDNGMIDYLITCKLNSVDSEHGVYGRATAPRIFFHFQHVACKLWITVISYLDKVYEQGNLLLKYFLRIHTVYVSYIYFLVIPIKVT